MRTGLPGIAMFYILIILREDAVTHFTMHDGYFWNPHVLFLSLLSSLLTPLVTPSDPWHMQPNPLGNMQ